MMSSPNKNKQQQVQFFLVPQPGSKPEFLAACVPVDPSPSALRVWEQLSSTTAPQFRLVIEGYTRDGWAWKPAPAPASLVDLKVKSVDGRNKLPGFVKYLKDRTKSAYGRFGSRGVLVVSYVQPGGTDPSQILCCRVSLDLTAIPQCTLTPLLSKSSSNSQQQQQPSSASIASAPRAATTTGTNKAKPAAGSTTAKSGLLGKLVGAQQRTNQHMISTAKKVAAAPAPAPGGSGSGSASSSAPSSSSSAAPPPSYHVNTDEDDALRRGDDALLPPPAATGARTAQQVFAEFRQAMQDRMLDFDMAEDEEVVQVTVALPEHTAGLSADDRAKVTMEVLKYMVYEAAEEVNEEWVVHKEPSEFVDEATFSVYKEGAAPPEVLEEINRAELPDEIKAQQRAIAAERQRQADQASQQHLHQVLLRASQNGGGPEDEDEDDQLEALNQRKRDRRTIEDYERQKREAAAAKKGRP